MCALQVIGIDSGFSYMKAMTSTMYLVIPNVISDGDDRVLSRSMGADNQGLLQNLDVEVQEDEGSKHYFVGDLALREGDRPNYIWDIDRVNSVHARAVLLTTLAVLCKKDGENFYISTGLPVQDYVTELKGIYESSLTGKHSVTFKSGPLAGTTKNFSIARTKVSAQGLGIYFNEIITNMCTLANSPYARGKVGIVDIGFRTSNLILVDDMRPRRSLSEGMEAGMSDAYDYLRDYLIKKGLPLELEKVEKEFWKDTLTFGDKRVELAPVREKALTRLAEQVTREIKRRWRRVTDLNHMLVAGGGAMALFEKMNLPGKILVNDAQLANARGFFKTANLKNIYQGDVSDDQKASTFSKGNVQ